MLALDLLNFITGGKTDYSVPVFVVVSPRSIFASDNFVLFEQPRKTPSVDSVDSSGEEE